MIRFSFVLTGIVGAALLLPAVSHAQRPSFGELEARQTALEVEQARDRDAACAKADADGDTYRPYVCDPRCDCFDVQSWASVTSCTESSPGDFDIVAVGGAGTCSLDVCTQIDFIGFCSSDTPMACTSDAHCGGAPGSCITSHFVCANSISLCSSDAECNTPVRCDSSSLTACTSDGDCSGGEVCEGSPKQCVEACAVDADCPALPVAIGLENVGAIDSATAASCDVLAPLIIPFNANDAHHCLSQVEGLLGASCTYLCGDGEIDPGETCDDGNTTPGDGCDASCQTEP